MGCGASTQPSETASSSAGLGITLAERNMTTVVLCRHAKTEPRDPDKIAEEWGQESQAPNANAWMLSDLSRQLTDQGREQSKLAKQKWFHRFKPSALVASEAIRARETRELIAQGSVALFLTVKSLHPCKSNSPDCERMFDTLGYASLDAYYAKEAEASAKFGLYGAAACKELDTVIRSVPNAGGEGDTLFIFGHAVFLNAVALNIAAEMGMGEQEKAKIRALDLGEAEGIALINGTTMEHLHCQ